MPRTTSYIALLWALTCLAAADRCTGQSGDYEHHPWARFGVGSWKKVRVLTETLDENGVPETTTTEETKTSLVQVDGGHYTLKVETTVEVAGRRFLAAPKYITRGFNGELYGQKAQIQELGYEEVAICGRRYRSEVKRIVINGPDSKLESKVHYSSEVTPHVVRRETKATAGNVNSFESLVEVVALDMDSDVLGEIRPSSHVKTVRKQANGERAITLEVQCVDVPGAVVSHTEQRFAGNDRLVRRQKLELLGYEALAKQDAERDRRKSPRGRQFPRERRRRGLKPAK